MCLVHVRFRDQGVRVLDSLKTPTTYDPLHDYHDICLFFLLIKGLIKGSEYLIKIILGKVQAIFLENKQIHCAVTTDVAVREKSKIKYSDPLIRPLD
jgi:hypothetical protein